MRHIIVFSACANKEEALKIAGELLKRRVAACVNLLPIRSLYRWKGRVRNESEYLLIIKTRSELFEGVRELISELSSYEVPEIVSVKIDNGLSSYLKWIDQETLAK
jgi:periplasmic divalent cation tolerance protein